jgi:hypothetical protein
VTELQPQFITIAVAQLKTDHDARRVNFISTSMLPIRMIHTENHPLISIRHDAS